ncbi:hypothetical protein [Sphingomonas paucimobilis]|uniref:hypothetical protein n=1 Tax=Sphingomonas paucimobilis TaxID=13689 RepID=UPI0028D32F3B|nr:hypothetical protein [Sphingomonas paucimobilis]
MSGPQHLKDQPHQVVINERRSGRGMILLFAMLALLVLGIYYALHQTGLEERREARGATAAKADPSTRSDANPTR